MAPTLTVRAWNPHDGNPGSPEHVLGIPVDRLLAKRPDVPGALVALRDRRLALTGQVAAIGRHRVLRTYVRGRAPQGRPRLPRLAGRGGRGARADAAGVALALSAAGSGDGEG